jgi:hypothetical protein
MWFSTKIRNRIPKKIAPCVKWATITLVVVLATQENLTIKHLDVKITHLNGDPNEELYMLQLKTYIVEVKENLICRLKKEMYGLKQVL